MRRLSYHILNSIYLEKKDNYYKLYSTDWHWKFMTKTSKHRSKSKGFRINKSIQRSTEELRRLHLVDFKGSDDIRMLFTVFGNIDKVRLTEKGQEYLNREISERGIKKLTLLSIFSVLFTAIITVLFS